MRASGVYFVAPRYAPLASTHRILQCIVVAFPAPANIHDLEIVLFGLVLIVGLLSLELLECLFLQVGVAFVSLVTSDS